MVERTGTTHVPSTRECQDQGSIARSTADGTAVVSSGAMASLARCPSCRGFVPASIGSCPNCGASAPFGTTDRVGFWLKAMGGASVAMTLMACYGVPPDDPDPTDGDTTEGSGGGSDTDAPASSTGGGAESTGAAASSGGAEPTTGDASTGGSEGSSGAGHVDQQPAWR